MKRWPLVLAGLLLVAFALLLWPGLWHYSDDALVRVNRITGEVQRRKAGSWTPF